MQSTRSLSKFSCRDELSHMFYVFSRKLKHLCSKIRLFVLRRSRPKLVIKRLTKFNRPNSRPKLAKSPSLRSLADYASQNPIRIASFNAALFSLAPAVPKAEKSLVFIHQEEDDLFANNNKISYRNSTKPASNTRPKGILKQSESDHNKLSTKSSKPKAVSINLPENEISLAQNKLISIIEDSSSQTTFTFNNTNSLMRSPIYFPPSMNKYWLSDANLYGMSTRTIFDVLKEVDADVLALQDVKAEEEKEMKPLSDLARALAMNYYVFAESWAPEYGNAVLSKWPIKKWKVQKIYDDQDFRNVIKATIDVPWTGELNVYCTQLDHLDENWRMKQIDAIIKSNDQPHLLLGGLNSLDASDYSSERWNDIVKYYEELGKPTPRVEVINFLKEREYTDAKHFPGECEPVVMIAKGQNVQGTCKYGTRVDYILGSQGLPCEFVPGSYSVFSSKGTSDHHIVKVDIKKVNGGVKKRETGKTKSLSQRVVRLSHACSSRGNWEIGP